MTENQLHPQQLDKQKIRSKTIGNYILGKTLGKGTFGKVKLAEQILTGEKVAIKILEKDRIIDVADVERVSREIHILKLIRHPNIIQLYEIIETPKQLFLVMQYMENGQLFDYIVKNKKIPQEQACKFFQQIISGIEYIHKLNIVHRDLKPQNLLLDYDNTIRIVDFGLSNTYKKDQRLKTACGSPCYAAPQMIEGKQKYQALLVDIWSAGVILYAMLCGSLPFQDPQTSKLYQKILAGQYKVPKHLSPDAKDLLSKILNVNPEKRFRIEDIKKHKWWSLASSPTCSDGLIVGYHKIPIQNQILQKMKSLSFDVDLSKKCVQANRHNHSTTTYYLLLKKFLKQGGISKADLGSKYFDKNLIQPNRRKQKNQTTNNNSNQNQNSQNEKQSKFNFLNLLKNRGIHKGQVESSDLKQKKQQLLQDPKSLNNIQKNNKILNDSKNNQNSTKRGRSPTRIQNNQVIKTKYRQKYGASLVSRSNDRTRNNSIRNNNQITTIQEKFKQYRAPDNRRNSLTSKGNKKYSYASRGRDNSQPSYQPQLNKTYLIGSEVPYVTNGIPKWRNAATIEVNRPYINRRAQYH